MSKFEKKKEPTSYNLREYIVKKKEVSNPQLTAKTRKVFASEKSMANRVSPFDSITGEYYSKKIQNFFLHIYYCKK